jgi:hypothetical protein
MEACQLKYVELAGVHSCSGDREETERGRSCFVHLICSFLPLLFHLIWTKLVLDWRDLKVSPISYLRSSFQGLNSSGPARGLNLRVLKKSSYPHSNSS